MKMKLTEAEEKLNTDEEFSAWWDKNYKKACDFAGNNADVIAHALYDAADEEDADALDAFYDQTAKHMALDGLYMLGIDEFEALMGDYSRVNVKDWARVVDEGWSEDDVRDAMTQAMLDAGVEDVGDYDQGGDTVAKKLGELGVDVRPYFNAENRSDYGDDDGEDLDETFRGVYRKTLREAASSTEQNALAALKSVWTDAIGDNLDDFVSSWVESNPGKAKAFKGIKNKASLVSTVLELPGTEAFLKATIKDLVAYLVAMADADFQEED